MANIPSERKLLPKNITLMPRSTTNDYFIGLVSMGYATDFQINNKTKNL